MSFVDFTMFAFVMLTLQTFLTYGWGLLLYELFKSPKRTNACTRSTGHNEVAFMGGVAFLSFFQTALFVVWDKNYPETSKVLCFVCFLFSIFLAAGLEFLTRKD